MKLSEHTEQIRQLIDRAFRNRLGRMGISENLLSDIETIPSEYRAERIRMETIREVFIAETEAFPMPTKNWWKSSPSLCSIVWQPSK